MLRDSMISQLRKCTEGRGRCNQMSWEFMDDELLKEDVWGGNLGFILPLLQAFSGGFFLEIPFSVGSSFILQPPFPPPLPYFSDRKSVV